MFICLNLLKILCHYYKSLQVEFLRLFIENLIIINPCKEFSANYLAKK